MHSEKQHLFDKPENIKKVLYGLYGCCAVLLVLDFVVHRHIYHSWEALWGFYPLYGFVGCVLLVLVAKGMRIFLMRDEHYYDCLERDSLERDSLERDRLEEDQHPAQPTDDTHAGGSGS